MSASLLYGGRVRRGADPDVIRQLVPMVLAQCGVDLRPCETWYKLVELTYDKSRLLSSRGGEATVFFVPSLRGVGARALPQVGVEPPPPLPPDHDVPGREGAAGGPQGVQQEGVMGEDDTQQGMVGGAGEQEGTIGEERKEEGSAGRDGKENGAVGEEGQTKQDSGTEDKKTGDKGSECKRTDNKGTEGKGTEDKGTEDTGTKDKGTEGKGERPLP
eukprot:gene54605-60535_t